jgi:hypothetical protein
MCDKNIQTENYANRSYLDFALESQSAVRSGFLRYSSRIRTGHQFANHGRLLAYSPRMLAHKGFHLKLISSLWELPSLNYYFVLHSIKLSLIFVM